jgi:polysaccharide pyruvyl transferase CsaB
MNILLAGYFGYSNNGDETILDRAIYQIKQHHPKQQLSVLSQYPEKVKKKHNVNTYNRKKISHIIAAIDDADLLVFPGGSIFQDRTSLNSLIYYLSYIIIAKIVRTRVILFAQGFSPFKSFTGKILFRYMSAFINKISVRDKESLAYLKKIKIKKPLELVDDLAINLLPLTTKKSLTNTIGINLREFSKLKTESHDLYAIVSALIQCNKELNVNYLFIPLHPSDLSIAKTVQKLMGPDLITVLDYKSDPAEIVNTINRTQLFIGNRLHSLIFSANCYVPFIGLSYDPKVSSFCQAKQQLTIQQTPLNKQTLNKAITTIWNKRQSYRQSLKNISNYKVNKTTLPDIIDMELKFAKN